MFLRSKAAGYGSISRVICSIVLLCVSSIIRKLPKYNRRITLDLRNVG